MVLKQDGGGPAHFSTHSLPTSYLPKEKPQAIHNGYDDERVPDIPDRYLWGPYGVIGLYHTMDGVG